MSRINPDNLFVSKCKHCGKIFRTDRKKVVICDDCRKLKSNKQKHKQSKELQSPKSIREIISIMEDYNQKHKTGYTYGQFVAGVKSGEIEI